MLKRIFTMSLAVTLAIMPIQTLANTADADKVNLLENGGFEDISAKADRYTGTGAQGWPFFSNWRREGYFASVDSAVSRSGVNSMKLGGGIPDVRVAVAQTVTGLDPDKYYKVSGYIKCEDYLPSKLNGATGPTFRVNPVNTTSYYHTDTIVKSKELNNVDWTYVENIFTPGKSDIRIDCFFEDGQGYAYYDDVTLTEYTPYTSVKISENSVSIKTGETVQLTAMPYPQKQEKPEIMWKSSNPDVAAVDENGNVTASTVNNGEAIISAVINEDICVASSAAKKLAAVPVEGICKVTVTGGKVFGETEHIKLDKKSASLVKNKDTLQLKVYSIPSKPADDKIIWATSDKNVAVVTDGFVVPVGAGTANITAMAADNTNALDYCIVTVTEKGESAAVSSDFTESTNIDFDITVKNSGYPKLLFTFDDLAHIRGNAKIGHTANTFAMMEKAADNYLKTGDRIHGNNAAGGRVLHYNVSNLAMTGYVKRDMRYIDRAIDLLVSSAEAYSAQDYYNMNGDIGMGDAAHAYAVGYDWLYPFMNDEQKEKIRKILYEVGEKIHTLDELKTEKPAVTSNHNSVASGGMGLAALVLGDRPEWLSHAREQIAVYYQTSMDSTGFNGEGISYYCYGALGAHTFSEAYLRAHPGDDLIEKYSKSREFLDMLVNYTKPGGHGYVTLGDSSGVIDPAGGIIYLISKYRHSAALWAYLEITGINGDKTYGIGASGNGASAPYILIWADNSIIPKSPADLGMPLNSSYVWGYETYRDGWDDLSTLVTFTSGYTPHRGHNQRDENTFTFYAKGEEFAIDPGYYPSETLSHNGLLIDGVGQAVPGGIYNIHGKIIEKREFENASYVVGDATDTYPKRLGANSVQRRMLFSRGETPYILIIDDIKKDNNSQSVYSWLLQTTKENKIVTTGSQAKIIGSNRGAVMNISFPFSDDVILRTDTFERRKVSGAMGTYVASNTCQTLEAVTFGGSNKRIVSLVSACDYGFAAPTVTVTGDENNGVINVQFYDGTADVITVNGNDVNIERKNTEKILMPSLPQSPEADVLNDLPEFPLTIEINGNLQDFDNAPTIIDGVTYINTEEFTDKLKLYTDISNEDIEDIIKASGSETAALRDICTCIGAGVKWNGDARHIIVQTASSVDTVVGPNAELDDLSGEKLMIAGIDARLDQNENPPANAIDGNLATNYAVQGEEGIPVILELDDMHTVSGLAIAFSKGNERINRFNIEVSEDKEKWIRVMSCESSGSNDEFEGYEFMERKAKYIKIVGFGNTSNNWNTFREIQVYGK